MKLPSFKRLFSSDFPEEFKSLVEQFGSSLNYGIEVLYQALNKEITLRDNIKCTVRDITVTVNASGIPTTPISFKLDTMGKVEGVIVISAQNLVNSTTYPISGILITGQQVNSLFQVSHITGLQANQPYTLRAVAFCA